MTFSKRWSLKDFFTKDMVLRWIIGRRGRRVEADKKKIWDNWSFLRICCAGLSILKISWATGVGLSWFFLRSKANFRGYDLYEDHFFRFYLYKRRNGWEVWGLKLTKDVDEGWRIFWRRMFSDEFSAKETVWRTKWPFLRDGWWRILYKGYGLKKD